VAVGVTTPVVEVPPPGDDTKGGASLRQTLVSYVRRAAELRGPAPPGRTVYRDPLAETQAAQSPDRPAGAGAQPTKQQELLLQGAVSPLPESSASPAADADRQDQGRRGTGGPAGSSGGRPTPTGKTLLGPLPGERPQPGEKTVPQVIAATLPAEAVSADDREKFTQMWQGALTNAQLTPGMTIKAPAPGTGLPAELVIGRRALRHIGQQSTTRADYELLSLLGEGGVGVVHVARQTCIDRTVAVKMLRDELAADREQRHKFLSEAVVTGDLDHPNIVPIYELGADEAGRLYYSMKRVRGTPWIRVMAEKSQSENLEILMKVADAVAFSHSRGVIHRDLKPENVMLGDFGEVLVMDWGLAVATSGSPKFGSITQSSAMGGTPAYMAPEMATGPIERIGPASDVYLLGAILYEVVTGRTPHTGPDVMACLFAAANNEIQPTHHSGELVDIALKAMSTDPAQRHQSVQEFQAAIRQYLSHAESLVLLDQAERDLEAARRDNDYQLFSRAVFGFQEAGTLWRGNLRASAGEKEARLAYARSAAEKGDFDLAASLLDPDDDAHARLLRDIRLQQRDREARQQRLKTLRRTTTGLAVSVFVVVTVGLFFVLRAERQARGDRDRALAAERKAKIDRDAAITARTNEAKQLQAAIEAKRAADREKEEADKARQKEEEAKKLADAEKEKAKTEEAKAIAARQAEQYGAYLARMGLAAAKIDENAFDKAQEILAEYNRPDAPELHWLRHWEWGRLSYLCARDVSFYDLRQPVEAVAFSPDGRFVVSGGWDGAATIRDRETGADRTLPHAGATVHAVAVSPRLDPPLIATGCNDQAGYLRLWNAATGEEVRRMSGHKQAVVSVSFSRDGQRLLSASLDGTARLWDVATGRHIRTYAGHYGWVWWAAFSPDERRIVTASQDGTAIVWETETARFTAPFRGHKGPVYTAAFAPDGKQVATAGYDQRILLWDPSDVKPVDYAKLATGLPLEAPRYKALQGHSAPVRAVVFTADGQQLLSAGHDNAILVWNVPRGQLLKTMRGHSSWVRSLALSGDEQYVASAGYDNFVRVWNLAQYEEMRVLRGHGDAVLAADFSFDGKRVVTASRDRTARIWDMLTGQELHKLAEGHEFLASAAVFLGDGQTFATAAVDNRVCIWSIETQTQLLELSGTGRAAALAAAPPDENGRVWLLTGGDQKNAQLWDAATGQRIRNFEGHAGEVTAVAISPDRRFIYTGDAEGQGRLFDAQTGTLLQRLSGHGSKVTAALFLPSSQRLLTASLDNAVFSWDVATGRLDRQAILRHVEPQRRSGASAVVTAMALSPDGTQLVTVTSAVRADASAGSASGATRLAPSEDDLNRAWHWDLASGRLLKSWVVPGGDVSSVAISPDGLLALTASGNSQVRLWDLKDAAPVAGGDTADPTAPLLDLERYRGNAWAALFSPDGTSLLTVGGNDIRLWSIDGRRDKARFRPHGAVSSARFSPADPRFVVTASWDGSAKIWDTQARRAIRRLDGGHRGPLHSAAFSPDGATVLTAGDDGLVLLWDAQSGTVIRSFEGHTDAVRSAAFSADGSRIVTASSDKTARIWVTASGELLQVLSGHEAKVLCAAFSPDGRFVITGDQDNTARIFTVEGQPLLNLTGHTAAVAAVAMSEDNRRALTGSQDGTAKLWDTGLAARGAEKIRGGQEILTLDAHAQELTAVAFSRDGRAILTASRDGTAIIWPADDWRQPAQPAALTSGSNGPAPHSTTVAANDPSTLAASNIQ
jgi:hypothetical protein